MDVVNVVRAQRLYVDYSHVASVALLFYDYLLTLHLEIILIWFSPWNYAKVLFLLMRYLPIVNSWLMLFNRFGHNIPGEVCEWTYPVSTWVALFALLVAEVILMIRTWAVLHRDWRVGLALAVIFLCSSSAECYVLFEATHSLKFKSSPSYNGYRGCSMTGFSNIFFVNFALLTLVDAIVLWLMATNAYSAYKYRKNDKLWSTVHRDGILFYCYLLIVNIATLITVLVLPMGFLDLLVGFQCTLYSLFTTRVIVNIRKFDRDTSRHYTETEMCFERPTPDETQDARPASGHEGVSDMEDSDAWSCRLSSTAIPSRSSITMA